MARRTITIDEENERNLNQLRGWLLTERNKEVDYTSAINMVLSLGFNTIEEGEFSQKQIAIADKYIFHSP